MIPLKDINPTTRFPLLTVLLIIANILVFVHQTLLGPGREEIFISSFGLVPAWLFYPEKADIGALPAIATIFTSIFLHGGLLHLASNMLYLWIFGNNVEDATGRLRYIIFYLICGTAVACSHALAHISSVVPMIGASGAVLGVLGADLLLYPKAGRLLLSYSGFI